MSSGWTHNVMNSKPVLNLWNLYRHKSFTLDRQLHFCFISPYLLPCITALKVCPYKITFTQILLQFKEENRFLLPRFPILLCQAHLQAKQHEVKSYFHNSSLAILGFTNNCLYHCPISYLTFLLTLLFLSSFPQTAKPGTKK